MGSDAGKRILEGAREALEIARGNQPAARIHFHGHAYVPENRWKPIDTAPKDGTMILAALDWKPMPSVLFWNRHPEVDCWECPASGVPDYIKKIGGWRPTHWMPLPAPPPPGELT